MPLHPKLNTPEALAAKAKMLAGMSRCHIGNTPEAKLLRAAHEVALEQLKEKQREQDLKAKE